MNEVTITVPNDPVAQKRPRFSRKQGRAYNDQRSIQDCVTWHIATQWGEELLKDAVSLEMTFYMKIPQSVSKKRRDAMLGAPCLKRPDLDNFVKLYLDCMQGIVLSDDSIVWNITAKKIWSDEPRTEIKVSTPITEEES